MYKILNLCIEITLTKLYNRNIFIGGVFMKKVITVLLVITMVITSSIALSMVGYADYEAHSKYNLLDAQTSTFEGGLGKWEKGLADGDASIAKGKGIKGDAMLSGPRAASWACAYLNVSPIFLDNGVGMYDISLYMKAAEKDTQIRLMFRDVNDGYIYDCSPNNPVTVDEWVLFELQVDVIEVDKAKGTYTINIQNSGNPNALAELDSTEVTMTDQKLFLAYDNGEGPVYIDNVCIVNLNTIPTPVPTPSPTPSPIPSPTPIPTQKPATTAPAVVPTSTNTTGGGTADNTLTIVLIATAAVLLLGGGATFFILKSRKAKNGEDIDISDTNKDE